VIALYVSVPLALVLSYELWNRRFNGKEQKILGQPPSSGHKDETRWYPAQDELAKDLPERGR
jgi:hypothetical protein